MSSPLQLKEYGFVKQVHKSIAKIGGLANCMNGQLVYFGDLQTKGIIAGFDENDILVLMLKTAENIKPNDKVYTKLETFGVPVGENFLGRIVNALCEPCDLKKEIQPADYFPIFQQAPGVLERVPIKEVLETGIKMIDMMIPLGKGQRELIIGDRMTGKTTIVLDTIINQKGKGIICIYCCIGKSQSTLAKAIRLLQKTHALDYTIVVAADASAPLGQQYLAPYVACSLGEYFMYKGMDVLVGFDDMTKHAWVYRQLSLLLERSPGRDAYPGDIFYLHSQLIERAGKLSPERGSGSMTFLPIVETLQGDVTGYVPSNLISMTDGQIYLSSTLFSEGFKPAIDLGLSVSRIGNKVQWPAIRELSGMLRLEYLKFKELERLTKIKSGISEEIEEKLKEKDILVELLKQESNRPVSLQEQVVLLYALRQGFLKKCNIQQVREFKNRIRDFINQKDSQLLNKILAEKSLNQEMISNIEKILLDYFQDNSSVE